MPENFGDEEALQHFNQNKRVISQNRLLIVSSVNLLTFLLSLFSISYYKWAWVEIISLSEDNMNISMDNSLWVNLLYGKQFDIPNYEGFNTLSQVYCRPNDAACRALFIEFNFTGLLVFFIFVTAYALQLLDFYQVLRYIVIAKSDSKQNMRFKHSLEAKDSFKHIITIISYSIGLGLNLFSLSMMKIRQFKYSISFWIFFASLIVFVLCVIYKNYSIRKIQQQSLMLNLIEGQRSLRNKQTEDKEETGSGQFQI